MAEMLLVHLCLIIHISIIYLFSLAKIPILGARILLAEGYFIIFLTWPYLRELNRASTPVSDTTYCKPIMAAPLQLPQIHALIKTVARSCAVENIYRGCICWPYWCHHAMHMRVDKNELYITFRRSFLRPSSLHNRNMFNAILLLCLMALVSWTQIYLLTKVTARKFVSSRSVLSTHPLVWG